MKGQQKEAKREAQLARTLDKIFYTKKFADEIVELRKEIGIPTGGFESLDDYQKFLAKDKKKGSSKYFLKIQPNVHALAFKFGMPSNYAHWMEAFLALGFKYKEFENYSLNSAGFIVHGVNTSLDINTPHDDHVSLHIYPGAKLNSVDDFLRQNFAFIESILETRAELGKVSERRVVGTRDRKEILAMADRGEIDDTGTWIAGIQGIHVEVKKPECLIGIGTDQIRKIVTEERSKRTVRKKLEKRK